MYSPQLIGNSQLLVSSRNEHVKTQKFNQSLQQGVTVINAEQYESKVTENTIISMDQKELLSYFDLE